jgi:hypothetical protein
LPPQQHELQCHRLLISCNRTAAAQKKKLPLPALTTSLESQKKTLPEIRFPTVYGTREWIEGKWGSKRNKNARRQLEKQNTPANTEEPSKQQTECNNNNNNKLKNNKNSTSGSNKKEKHQQNSNKQQQVQQN